MAGLQWEHHLPVGVLGPVYMVAQRIRAAADVPRYLVVGRAIRQDGAGQLDFRRVQFGIGRSCREGCENPAGVPNRVYHAS